MLEVSTISDSIAYCHYGNKALIPDDKIRCSKGYHHTECKTDYNEFMALKKQMQGFSHVNISHNKLKKLPTYIPELPELPAWIGNLNLFDLNAGHNNIISVGNFPKNLHRLDLSHNQIEYLPDIDIKPYNLNFDFNPLKNIPSNWFKDMEPKALHQKIGIDENNVFGIELSFTNCALTSVPDTLSNVNIIKLSLSHNNITSLPADLGLDHFIWKFDLSNNPISQLPEHLFDHSGISTLNNTTIQRLPKLTPTTQELYLRNTPISEFPDIRNIKELFSLDIRGSNITEIPAYVKNIKISNVYIDLDDLELGVYFNSNSNIYLGDSYNSVSVKHIEITKKQIESFYKHTGIHL